MHKRPVPCNLCGGEQFTVVYPDELGDTPPTVDYNFSRQTRKTFQIVRCTSCGLLFTNPRPSLQSAYDAAGAQTERLIHTRQFCVARSVP